MSPHLLALTVAALLLVGTSTTGATADIAGIVKSVAGRVAVIRGGSTLPAVPNTRLCRGDVVETGADGKAGLILDDDTIIALGPKSRIAIQDFAFRPEQKRFALVARVFRGTVSFLSGRIARLAPATVHILTPEGTVGIRGTHLLIRVD